MVLKIKEGFRILVVFGNFSTSFQFTGGPSSQSTSKCKGNTDIHQSRYCPRDTGYEKMCSFSVSQNTEKDESWCTVDSY